VSNIIFSLLIILSLPLSSTTQRIEQGFLQNNSKMLYSLFPEMGFVTISLPEPIVFSDQISNQQAYFFFKKIFTLFTTFEFYSDREAPPDEKNSTIFKTRWSFRDKKDGSQYVFRVYFYLRKAPSPSRINPTFTWKITEIKAEKI
jgi:hypothetical protein